MKKRIAVPTNNGQVAQHFGRCPEYTILEVKDCDILNTEVIENPGHKPNFLPNYLSDLNVDIVLAGGMGQKAFNLFQQNNIEVVTGASGLVKDSVKAYLNNELDADNELCNHSNHNHNHNHYHH
ncbi:MAG: NifB/NifX family molybdenum-iron cluster-binding protein [Bacillota bacterium]